MVKWPKMKSVDYLNELQKTYGWSDYRIAQEIGLTQSAISQHRSGNAKAFSDEVCLLVAELLDIEPMKVVADMHGERASKDKVKKFWKEMGLEYMACIVLALFIAIHSPNAEASTFEAQDDNLPSYRLCAYL